MRAIASSGRSSSASSSKGLRGWFGLGAMRSTATSRSSGPSAAETARIAARPRPMPRLATGGHLLRQLEIRVRTGALRVVVDHREAKARRLSDANIARDDGVEDERREMLAHLALHVARQPRPAVVHREQHPGDDELRIEFAMPV